LPDDGVAKGESKAGKKSAGLSSIYRIQKFPIVKIHPKHFQPLQISPSLIFADPIR